MAILHQVALHPEDQLAWESLATACVVGDTVVFLDAAVAKACALPCWEHDGVRVCVPRAELIDGGALPQSFDLIDDGQWCELIVAHELIQHWM